MHGTRLWQLARFATWLLLAMTMSCGGDEPAAEGDSLTGVVLSADNDQPLAGVRVRAVSGKRESEPAHTDARGRFTLRAAPAGSVVRFEALQHAPVAKPRWDKASASTAMKAFDGVASIEAALGGSVRGTAEQRAFVRIPAGALKGSASVGVAAPDPRRSSGLRATSGAYVAAVSGARGRISVASPMYVGASAGELVTLTDAASIEIDLPVWSEMNVPNLALFAYDEQSQIWNPAGEVTTTANDRGVPVYRARIKKLGWFAVGEFYSDLACVRGCAKARLDGAAQPVEVSATGLDHFSQVSGQTDENGCFQLEVRARSRVMLELAMPDGAALRKEANIGSAGGACTDVGELGDSPRDEAGVDAARDASAQAAPDATQMDAQTDAGTSAGPRDAMADGSGEEAREDAGLIVTACAPGEYLSTAATGQACTPCPSGTFSDSANATSCRAHTLCGDDTVLTQSGSATSDAQCRPCEFGTFSRGPNATTCVAGYAQVAPGYLHVCALRSNGRVSCWGHGEFQPSQLPKVRFTQIVSGNAFSCGLREATKTPLCWGAAVENVPVSVSFDQLAANVNSRIVCGIRTNDHGVQCFGYDLTGQIMNAPTGAFRTVSTGLQTSCAIREADGQLVCWGNPQDRLVTEAPITTSFTQVAVGWDVACALRASDGGVQCWGVGGDGETLSQIPAGPFSSLSLDYYRACAQRADSGATSCWGMHSRPGSSSIPSGTELAQVSAGDFATCGVRKSDKMVECWGLDDYGQLSGMANRSSYSQLTAGYWYECATRTADASVHCWGANGHGQSTPPEKVAFSQLAAGQIHSCGIRSDNGAIQCWGRDSEGLLTAVPDGAFEQMETSTFLACAVRKADRSVVCWGSDTGGAVTSVPAGRFTQVSVGDHHACAIGEFDQRLRCWGDNSGSSVSTAPTDIAVRQVVSIGNQNCAVRASDGAVVCWGSGGSLVSPTALGGAFTKIGISSHHGCGLHADGTVECWGTEYHRERSEAPVGTFVDISVEDAHSCALRKADGIQTCWGSLTWNPL